VIFVLGALYFLPGVRKFSVIYKAQRIKHII
jgi:preprotein translocase subunit SecG